MTPKCTRPRGGNQWNYGMKVHIDVDADSGLVHTVVGAVANVNDMTHASVLIHGKETGVYTDVD